MNLGITTSVPKVQVLVPWILVYSCCKHCQQTSLHMAVLSNSESVENGYILVNVNPTILNL